MTRLSMSPVLCDKAKIEVKVSNRSTRSSNKYSLRSILKY